jgi:hypothetical protein
VRNSLVIISPVLTPQAEDESSMIVDACMYAGEREALQMRLYELRDVADIFVIVESRRTFQDARKPLYLTQAADIVAGYPVRYVVMENFRGCTKTWDREAMQRNEMGVAIQSLTNPVVPGDSVCLFSDVDEIPRASAVRAYCAGIKHGDIVRLGGPHYMYALDCRLVAHPIWYGPHACAKSSLDAGLTPQRMRGSSQGHTYRPGSVMSAAWHMSFLGGRERILEKLRSWSHDDDSQHATEANIERAISTLTDWKPDRMLRFERVAVDRTWPQFVHDFPEQAREWLSPQGQREFDAACTSSSPTPASLPVSR